MNGSIIVVIVVIILIVLGIGLIATNSKRKRKKIMNNLFSLLENKNIKIDDSEYFNNIIIGLDHNSKTLIILKQEELSKDPDIFELKNINICKHNIPTKRTEIKDNLYLDLYAKDGVGFFRYEIYNAHFGMDPKKEIAFIEKWVEKINNCIK